MTINIDDPKKPGNGKVFVGLLLLALGIGFLLQQIDLFFIPGWLFSVPMAMIVWGLYIGAKHNFRNSSWFIITLVGLVWISGDIFPGHNLHHLIWPIGVMALGIWFILRRTNKWDQDAFGNNKWENKWNKYQYRNGNPFEPVVNPVTPVGAAAEPEGPTVTSATGSTTIPPLGGPASGSNLKGDDYLDTVSVFGGVNKTILSKNFRGGDIVNIFGGAELDFTQADINGRVIIDITQIFGGTKIIVPSNWQVVSDLAAVFASVDDKRIKSTATGDNTKILVLKGVSIFAGVDIRSY